MRRSVSFHPAAQQDADEAVAWYAERSVRAAVRFLDELDRVLTSSPIRPTAFKFSTLTSPSGFSSISVLHRFSCRRFEGCDPCRGPWEKTPTAQPHLKNG